MEDNRTNALKKLTELIKDAHIAMLTTMTPDGKHQARPMGLQEVEFDGDLWFFAFEDSDKVRDIRANPEVNVSFSDKNASSWVSIAGRADVLQDHAKAEDLWSPLMKAWFTDGLDTEGLILIKVHADSAEYWDSPHSKVVNLFAMVKAAATGDQPPRIGGNETVEL